MLAPSLMFDRRPELSRALADAEGRLWLARFEPPELLPHDRWTVLDGEGRPLARLRLPRRSKLVDVDDDRLLLVTTDSLDVQRVAVHRFNPAPR